MVGSRTVAAMTASRIDCEADDLCSSQAEPLLRMPTPPPPDSPPPLRAGAFEFQPGAKFYGSCRATWPPTLVWLGGVPNELVEYCSDSDKMWERFQ